MDSAASASSITICEAKYTFKIVDKTVIMVMQLEKQLEHTPAEMELQACFQAADFLWNAAWNSLISDQAR